MNLRKFIYGPGIDEPIMIVNRIQETEYRYYYHYDGLGSVIALSDGNGNVVETYEYGVFGAPTITDADDVEISSSGVSNNYMFTGRGFIQASAPPRCKKQSIHIAAAISVLKKKRGGQKTATFE